MLYADGMARIFLAQLAHDTAVVSLQYLLIDNHSPISSTLLLSKMRWFVSALKRYSTAP